MLLNVSFNCLIPAKKASSVIVPIGLIFVFGAEISNDGVIFAPIVNMSKSKASCAFWPDKEAAINATGYQ